VPGAQIAIANVAAGAAKQSRVNAARQDSYNDVPYVKHAASRGASRNRLRDDGALRVDVRAAMRRCACWKSPVATDRNLIPMAATLPTRSFTGLGFRRAARLGAAGAWRQDGPRS
jgi:hypothetical protein